MHMCLIGSLPQSFSSLASVQSTLPLHRSFDAMQSPVWQLAMSDKFYRLSAMMSVIVIVMMIVMLLMIVFVVGVCVWCDRKGIAYIYIWKIKRIVINTIDRRRSRLTDMHRLDKMYSYAHRCHRYSSQYRCTADRAVCNSRRTRTRALGNALQMIMMDGWMVGCVGCT